MSISDGALALIVWVVIVMMVFVFIAESYRPARAFILGGGLAILVLTAGFLWDKLPPT